MGFLKRHKVELFLFTFALTLRALLFFVNLNAEGGNLIETIHGGDGYFEISKNIVAGNGFSSETAPPYEPNPLRTPGYLYALAAVLWLTGSYGVAIALQMMIGALIPLLGRRISLALFPSERLALGVGILLAIEPYFVLFSSLLFTETLFIFLFLLFVLVFLSYLKTGNAYALAASAALLGFAILVKTTVQYLPICLVPLIIWHFRGKGWRTVLWQSAVFVSIIAVILAPWLYRNYRAFGVVGLSAQSAYNLYVYLAPSILALERGATFAEEGMKSVTPEERSGNAITLSTSSEYRRKALDIISAHPRGLALSVGVTFVSFFTLDGMLTVLGHAGYTPDIHLGKPAISLLFSAPRTLINTIAELIRTPLASVFIMRIVWIGITMLSFVGMYWHLQKNPWNSGAIFAILLIGYFLITSVVGGLGVTARYRMPISVFLFMFALVAIFELARYWNKRIKAS